MSFHDVAETTAHKLREMAPAIARALGWRLASPKPERGAWVEMHDPKEATLVVSMGARYPDAGRGRIVIHGLLKMQTKDGRHPSSHGIDNPTITVAVNRRPEEIAREIERRCLPAYLVACAAMAERIAEADADHGRFTAIVKRLGNVCGATLGQDGHLHLPNTLSRYGRLSVNADGGAVSIDGSFDPEQAETMLAALATLAKRRRR
jgi:hypothetical protein